MEYRESGRFIELHFDGVPDEKHEMLSKHVGGDGIRREDTGRIL